MNSSKWACPMFTISKPDGSLRLSAHLREVSKVKKWRPYPLPKITDMLQKLEGFFMYATLLDLNMGYYQHMRLTPFLADSAPQYYHEENTSIVACLWV